MIAIRLEFPDGTVFRGTSHGPVKLTVERNGEEMTATIDEALCLSAFTPQKELEESR